MKKIYLSPSDQDYNVYAVGNTNEAVQCRKIAVALVDALERCGFQAKAGLENGMSLRVSQSNEWGADLHLCIHTNAHNGKVKGTRLFCYSKSGDDYRACAAVMAALAPITPGESDSITVHHFYEVLNANAPTVYLEVAFHDNEEEAEWIINHVDEIAEAICKGVCNHYGVAYVTEKHEEEPKEEVNGATKYYVQTGAFSQLKNAEKQVAELKAAGFNAIIKTGENEVVETEKEEPKEVTFKEGDLVRMQKDAPIYGKNEKFSDWVYGKALFVRDIAGDRIVVSTVATGPITGPVDKKYLTKI